MLKISGDALRMISKATGAMIRKQFIVFPVVAPLSPDLTMRYLLEYLVGSGVKQLGTIAQISFGAWPEKI